MNKQYLRLFVVCQLLLVGVLFTLHHLFGFALSRGHYSPFSVGETISALTYDETHLYAPGPRRFMKEGTLPSEIDALELKGLKNGFPFLHSIVVGGVGKALGSLETAWILFHALLPALIWGLVILTLEAASANFVLNSALAWIYILVPFAPRNALLRGIHSFVQPLELTRTPHPGFSFCVLFLAIFFLIRALSSNKKAFRILAGIFGGLTFYTYYYYWVGFFSALALLGMTFLFQRRKDLFHHVVWIGGIGSTVAVPYLLKLAQASKQSGQMELLLRLGEFTRTPSKTGLGVFALLFACYIVGVRYFKEREFRQIQKIVLLAVIVAGALGLNFHLVTGYNPQHEHFYSRLINPIVFLIVCLTVSAFIKNFGLRFVTPLAAGFALLVVGMGAYRQYRAAGNTIADHRTDTERRELVAWIRDHVEPGKVVGTTDTEVLLLLPPVGGTWNFVPVGGRSMASDQEILKRYLTLSKIEQRTWEEVKTALLKHHVSEDRLWLHNSFVFFNRNILDPKLLGEAEKVWPTLSTTQELKERQLDYLALPKEKKRQLQEFPNAQAVYENQSWVLLETSPSAPEPKLSSNN